jgi:hypothetical protein
VPGPSVVPDAGRVGALINLHLDSSVLLSYYLLHDGSTGDVT